MCDWQTSDSNILHSRLLAARVYCAMTDRDIEVLDIRDKNKRISHLNKTGCLVGVLMHCVLIVIHKCYLIFCRKMFTIFYWSCVPFISRWSICLCLCNDSPCFCLFLWAWPHLLVFFLCSKDSEFVRLCCFAQSALTSFSCRPIEVLYDVRPTSLLGAQLFSSIGCLLFVYKLGSIFSNKRSKNICPNKTSLIPFSQSFVIDMK